MVFAKLVDVECELNLYVRVRILGVVHDWAILFLELRKLNGYGVVNRAAVSDGVSDVVGKGANREGEFVRRLGVVQEPQNEVSRAHVVSEVGKEAVSEGIIAKILDGAAAIGIGMSLPEL